jgi:hypothetical protein
MLKLSLGILKLINKRYLSTLSLNFIANEVVYANGILAPGFCPYKPKLTLKNLYNIKLEI